MSAKLKKVVKVSSEIGMFTEKSFQKTGKLYGKFWVLTLECGHEIKPFAKSENPPKRSKCWFCQE